MQMELFQKKQPRGGLLPSLSHPVRAVDPYANSKLMTFRLAAQKEKILKKMMYVSPCFNRGYYKSPRYMISEMNCLICVYACVRVCVCICVCVWHVYMYEYIYICGNVCVCICVCTC